MLPQFPCPTWPWTFPTTGRSFRAKINLGAGKERNLFSFLLIKSTVPWTKIFMDQNLCALPSSSSPWRGSKEFAPSGRGAVLWAFIPLKTHLFAQIFLHEGNIPRQSQKHCLNCHWSKENYICWDLALTKIVNYHFVANHSCFTPPPVCFADTHFTL